MLKRIPIRWRLAVAFAVSMAALLVALGALVYFRVDDALRRSVDQALQAQSAEALAHPDAGSLLDADARQSGMVAQVVAADGRIVRSDPASLSGLISPETAGGGTARRCSDDDLPRPRRTEPLARAGRSRRRGSARGRTPAPTDGGDAQPCVSRADRGGARRTASRDARGLSARGRGATSRRVDAAPRERDLGDHARRPAPGAARVATRSAIWR